MTSQVQRENLDALRSQIENGCAAHGRLHRLLEEWHRVDWTGITGGGRLIEATPIAIGSFDDALLRHVVHLDTIGLAFAQAEAKLYFTDPGHMESASSGAALDRAVGDAVRRCLAYGDDAAIWMNIADETLADVSGALVEPQPAPTLDLHWHGRRVLTTTLVAAGTVWVAGQDAGTLRYHGEFRRRTGYHARLAQPRRSRLALREHSYRCRQPHSGSAAAHRLDDVAHSVWTLL